MSFNKWTDEPFGTYSLKGYRKFFHNISINLSNSKFWFKVALVLRKLTLQNKLEIVDATPLKEFNVRLFPLDNIGDRLALFMPWYFEWEEFDVMEELLSERETFLDIGANTGYYSLIASKLAGEKGTVIAFEPNPIMYNRFLFNLKVNDRVGNVRTFDVGLADKEGEFTLALDPGNLGGASIMHEYGEHSVKVKCRPLTDLLEEEKIKKIDFMKIDVEGAEPIILNPFFSKADRSLWPKRILIETTNGIPFEDLGYRQIRKTKNNTVYELISAT